MAIEVLLQKRQKSKIPEAGMTAFGFLVAVGVALSTQLPLEPFQFLALLLTFAYALGAAYCALRVFRYGMVWADLKSAHLLEPLLTTPSDARRMVDQVAFYTLKRVTRVAALPALALTLPATLVEPAAGIILFGFCVGGTLMLSYLVQGWCLLSKSQSYWTFLAVPALAYGMLWLVIASVAGTALMLAGIGYVPEPLAIAAGLLQGLLVAILVPRAAALRGISPERRAAGSAKSRGKKTPFFPTENPVLGRPLTLFRTPWQRRLALAGILVAPILVWEAAVGPLLKRTNLNLPYCFNLRPIYCSWNDLVTGLVTLCLIAGGVAFLLTTRERQAGTLELLKTSRLSSSEIAWGWLLSACLPSWLLLSVFLPTLLTEAHIYEYLPGVGFTVLWGYLAVPLGALFGMVVGLRYGNSGKAGPPLLLLLLFVACPCPMFRAVLAAGLLVAGMSLYRDLARTLKLREGSTP